MEINNLRWSNDSCVFTITCANWKRGQPIYLLEAHQFLKIVFILGWVVAFWLVVKKQPLTRFNHKLSLYDTWHSHTVWKGVETLWVEKKIKITLTQDYIGHSRSRPPSCSEAGGASTKEPKKILRQKYMTTVKWLQYLMEKIKARWKQTCQ